MESLTRINDNFLESLIDDVVDTKDIQSAKQLLYNLKEPTPLLVDAINLCIAQHDGQFRKSGEPYAIHPILVACFVSFMGGDDAMVISALLHDVVEDTDYSIEQVRQRFGDEVAKIVEGLTKIVNIREDKLAPSGDSNAKLRTTALTFRRMLMISINDQRVFWFTRRSRTGLEFHRSKTCLKILASNTLCLKSIRQSPITSRSISSSFR